MACRLVAALIFSIAMSMGALAAPTPSVVPAQPAWSQLNASQRTALMPLAKEWNNISDDQRLKWLGIAVRYAKMTPLEQARVQDRMREWVALSPQDRERARAQYKVLRNMSAEAKKQLEQKWQEYEALPAEEKQRLKAAASKRTPKGRPLETPPVAAQSVVEASPPAVSLPHQTPPKPIVVAPVVPRRELGPGQTNAATRP